MVSVTTTVDSDPLDGHRTGPRREKLAIVPAMPYRRSESVRLEIVEQFPEWIVFWTAVDTATTVSGQCHKKQAQK